MKPITYDLTGWLWTNLTYHGAVSVANIWAAAITTIPIATLQVIVIVAVIVTLVFLVTTIGFLCRRCGRRVGVQT